MRPSSDSSPRIHSAVLLVLATMLVSAIAFSLAVPTEAVAVSEGTLSGMYFPDEETLQRYVYYDYENPDNNPEVLTAGISCIDETGDSYGYTWNYPWLTPPGWDIPMMSPSGAEVAEDSSYKDCYAPGESPAFKAGYFSKTMLIRMEDGSTQQCDRYHHITMDRPGYAFAGWKAYMVLTHYHQASGSPEIREISDENSGEPLVFGDGDWISADSPGIQEVLELGDMSHMSLSNDLYSGSKVYLVAQWRPAEHQVSFAFVGDVPDGMAAPAAQTVADGAVASDSEVASVSGYSFEGWYTDAACSQAYDFSTSVTSDITVYGKWTELADPVEPDPVEPDPVEPDPEEPDPTTPDSITTESTALVPASSEPAASETVVPASKAAIPQTGDGSSSAMTAALAAGAIAFVGAFALRRRDAMRQA